MAKIEALHDIQQTVTKEDTIVFANLKIEAGAHEHLALMSWSDGQST